MNATHYLYAAYAATWIIHVTYLWTVVGRYRKVRSKMRELNKLA
jgi:CcmD family protein